MSWFLVVPIISCVTDEEAVAPEVSSEGTAAVAFFFFCVSFQHLEQQSPVALLPCDNDDGLKI
jgi:hypothetical protein